MGVDACATLIAGWAGAAGCAVDLLPSPVGLHVVARSGRPDGRRTLLLGHHDTVFPLGTAAVRPVEVDGERALGPGVADMKGGILIGLAALERLAAHAPGASVELHCVPDEEGRNVAPYTLDSMRGADAALCLECGRPSGAIVTARKAGCWVTITAHGVPAHAGTSPDEGRSALRALARELLRIEGELHGSRPGMTAVATQLHAGEVKNTVPAEAWGTIDVRAHDDADLDHALARIRAVGHHEGVVFAFSDDRGFPPMRRAPGLAAAVLHELAARGSPRSRSRPAASPTGRGRATSACRPSMASGRSAATTTPSASGSSSRAWGRASTRSSRCAPAPARDGADPDRAVGRGRPPEIGWSVLPGAQGRGVATSATRAAIARAGAERRHRFLHAYPSVGNAPSNAVCRKLGFTLLGARDLEYPKGSTMRCNDWRLALYANVMTPRPGAPERRSS